MRMFSPAEEPVAQYIDEHTALRMFSSAEKVSAQHWIRFAAQRKFDHAHKAAGMVYGYPCWHHDRYEASCLT